MRFLEFKRIFVLYEGFRIDFYNKLIFLKRVLNGVELIVGCFVLGVSLE